MVLSGGCGGGEKGSANWRDVRPCLAVRIERECIAYLCMYVMSVPLCQRQGGLSVCSPGHAVPYPSRNHG